MTSVNGHLTLVSQGPGALEQMTIAARQAILDASHIVCYQGYARLSESLLRDKIVKTYSLGEEKKRARAAINEAYRGSRVALISSGDIGIYGMASVVMEELEKREDQGVGIELNLLPGVTAASACASLLGAPLSHDFATLSLSDLLCPWQWIKERAKALAVSDMVVALYNVQSRSRQTQFYEVIKLFLEHRSEANICGLVRNAYREDQSVELCSLSDLLDRELDMFTTVIVGNSHSRSCKGLMYTPRGYYGWRGSDKKTGSLIKEIPKGAIWIFSGTKDGNELALQLIDGVKPVVLSTATEYGERVALEQLNKCSIVSGSLGKEERSRLISKYSAKAIVDATHPFAAKISRQLVEISQELGLPLLRYERPSSVRDEEAKDIYYVRDMAEAALLVFDLGKRVFLATGASWAKEFVELCSIEPASIFARVTPSAESLKALFEAGLPSSNICAMQGPISASLNKALWSDWGIDTLVMKDSGAAGGFVEKLEAARALKMSIIVVERPDLAMVSYDCFSGEFQPLLDYLNNMEI